MPLYFVGILIPPSEYFKERYDYFQNICLNDNNLYVTIIDEYAYHIANFCIHRIYAHILLTVSEMVIFKILYLHKFSIIASMDEYFFTNFVTLINFMINFGFTIVKYSLGEHRRSNTYLHIFANSVDNTIPWPGP